MFQVNYYNTADTLSRAPLPTCDSDVPDTLNEEAEALMEITVTQLPASKDRLNDYRRAQALDPICSMTIEYCLKEWPDARSVTTEIKPYWNARGELTVYKDLLLHRSCIVVPKCLQHITIAKIHEGHQGILRCQTRARSSVWWPRIQHDISNMIKQCPTCVKKSTPPKEPLIPTELPLYPWQKIATDLFVLKSVNYLVVVDYFSRYPEVVKLPSISSSNVIRALKSMLAQHGIPETIISDNGPQYSSQEFAEFAKMYNFEHTTSSPYFPQSNGMAERTVKTVKSLLAESRDPYMALLTYRTTPFPWCNLSPAELLMGRRLRSNLPVQGDQLIPK